jgi:multidrug efflux pump subunit AcrB
MRKLIEYFVKYPVLGNSVMILIFVFGLFSFITTKTTFFPAEEARFININAFYPGASPEEIEEGITIKIEDAIKGITGVDRTTSTSNENSVSIQVELQYGADANVVLQDIQSTVNSISSFPVGMERLNVFKQEPLELVINLAVSGYVSLAELKRYGRQIERDLFSKQGISKLTLSGFPTEEIEVSFNENDLRAYGLTFEQTAGSIRAANIKITGGKIKGKNEELLIRADNKKYYAEDLKNHVLKTTRDGTIIRLKDVAEVKEKWSEDPNRFYYNGKQSISIVIQKTNDDDLFEIKEIVENYVNEFNSAHDDVRIDITRDRSKTIDYRMGILKNNGLIGIILIVLFLGLTLNPRLSFWVAISIPISFMGMFAIGAAYGLTINVMSLLGMILVVGILVDDGIVVAENIYAHYENGESPLKAAVNGTMEVLTSVFTGVVTTIIIFLIFFFLEGMLGNRAKDIAFVVGGALIFSLIELVIILPGHIAHSKALSGNGHKKKYIIDIIEKILFGVRDKLYKPLLKFSIKHPLVILSIPTAIFIITIGAVNGNIIKTTFYPNVEFDFVQITLELPAGTNDAITDSILAKIEDDAVEVSKEYLEQFPQNIPLLEGLTRNIGPNTHQGSVSLLLAGGEEREWDNITVRKALREKIGAIPEAEKLQIGSGRLFGMPVSIAIKSNNLEQLRDAKNELKEELNKIDQLKDVVDNDPKGLREVKISLNENAYNLGLSTRMVMNQVRGGFFGKEAQKLLRGIDEVKIWVRYAESQRREIEQLKYMRIRLADGRELPLSEIVDIEIGRGILAVNHIDGQRIIKVEADIASKDISVSNIIENIKSNILPEIKLKYPDVFWQFEGESRDSTKTMKSILRVVPSFLVLMFMLVVFTFRSFFQSVAVYILIPFSFIGVLWGHFLQGYIVSILSFFGAIALMGIVINDSLIFVNAFNRYLKRGQKFEEALINAGLSRFRPVILTSGTTIVGLAPLIFEPSYHAQFLSPMAISVAYGLIVGTVLTLLLIPTLLVLINKLKYNLQSLFGLENLSIEAVEPSIIEKKRLESFE